MKAGEHVLIHHVYMVNTEGRAEYELRAVQNILAWLREHGLDNFTYHQTAFDYGTVRQIARDINVIAFVAGIVLAQHSHTHKAVICSSADDLRRQAPMPWTQELRRWLTERMCGRELEWLMPNAKKTKAEVIGEMPPDLYALCWHCRVPKDGKPCGGCETCREVAAAEAWLKGG